MKTIITVLIPVSFLFISSVTYLQSNIQYVSPPCGNQCDGEVYDQPGICMTYNMELISKDASKTIAFYLQDGVEILDFAGPLEVFSYAGYKIFTVSKSREAIKSQGVLTVLPDYTIKDAPRADVIAFFGGNAASAYNDPEVIEWIRQQSAVDYYFSVCTGAFLLAEAGILDDQVATTFHKSLDNLQERYPKVDVRKNVRFVDNGKVITTAGISAGIDGALHLVAKLQGQNAAKRTAYYMEYDNWSPGNGLILSNDNPYEKIPANELQEYEGKYRYKDVGFVNLQEGLRNGELNALVGDKNVPIFYEQPNVFSDIDGRSVYFQRDGKNRIFGFTLEDDGVIYRKEK